MAPIEAVIIIVVAASVALAILASAHVVREGSDFGRSIAQLAFVWLMPIIGPLVTMHLLRREPEKHRLSETDPPAEVEGKIDHRSASYRPRRDERSTEESEPE